MITWPSTKARRSAGSVARPSTAPITDAGDAMYNPTVRRVGRRFVLAAAILLSAAATVAGAEWSEIGSGLPRIIAGVKSLAIDPAAPSRLYAVDARGRLFKTIDSGGDWKLCGSVAGVSFVVVDPTNSSTIYAVTQRGVFKSVDGGENWAGADGGLAGNTRFPFPTIAIDPLTPATLYAATTDGVFKSTDAARSWNKLDTVPPEAYGAYSFEGGVTIDPVSPSTIYVDFNAGKEQGILKSTDGGESWNILYTAQGISPHGLVVDLITPSTLYARSSNSAGSILKSTDGGQTWTMHPAAPPGTAVLSLVIDSVSPSTLYAIYWSSPSPRVWGILKSMDSGENWSVLDTGLPPYDADPGPRFSPSLCWPSPRPRPRLSTRDISSPILASRQTDIWRRARMEASPGMQPMPASVT